jgi:hypothetical protein
MRRIMKSALNLPILRHVLLPIILFIYVTPGAILYFSGIRKSHYMDCLFEPGSGNFLAASFRRFLLSYLYYTNVPKYRTLIIGQSQAGNIWCDIYHSRIESYDEVFDNLLNLLVKLQKSYSTISVLQVGCAGGGELYWLSKKVPSSVRLIGVDLNEHTITQNTDFYKDKAPIEFHHADVLTSSILTQIRPDLIFTSGTAEYFQEKELDHFIETIKSCGVKIILFHEPISLRHFKLDSQTRSNKRGNMAFNHAYGFKLQNHGARVEEYSQPSVDQVVLGVLTVGIFDEQS